MKKAVVTILLVLPFILMIIISFAARIVSNYQYINVESICVAKDERNCYGEEVLKLGLGATYDLEVRIYPEFATNDRVNYISNNEDVVTVSSDGVVYGVGYGKTTIRVESLENRDIYTIINFEVKDEYVSSVELDIKELTLTIKQNYELRELVNVYPITALNRNVIYTSSDTSIVSVDANGKLTAHSGGEAIITVTTVDGNKTDTCRVIVEDRVDFGFIDYVDGKDLYVVNTNQIDLNTLIEYDPELINLDDVVYEVIIGKQYTTLDTNSNILTFNQKAIILLEAKVKGTNYIASIYLKYE